ncbi:MAG: diaminopimelate epimerase [Capsulimonadaceae bacterium]|nr:diaminopimelate epimerase [Capsulimonadaceae bacterium]
MIEFSKYQGVGNDFVVVALDDVSSRDLPALARTLCERRFGVGSDGLLVIGQAPGGLAFRMFNPDGSEDMCGNGLRCSMLWAHRAGLVSEGESLLVHGFDGNRAATLNAVEDDARRAIVTVEMGVASFRPESVPFAGPTDGGAPPRASLSIDGRTVEFYPLSTGSAHAVVFGDDPLPEELFTKLSPLIENHPWFPERTSVMWTNPDGKGRYAVRIWERAAGETLGCGTGETAIAAAAWESGRVDRAQPITVKSKGGELKFSLKSGSLLMTGPAEWVFDGRTIVS